jgi:hypothetical protein
LDQIIFWLTGFDELAIEGMIERKVTFKTFFQEAKIKSNSRLIPVVICGYRVKEIENPLPQQVLYLEKLVDELAKGRTMEKIYRENQIIFFHIPKKKFKKNNYFAPFTSTIQQYLLILKALHNPWPFFPRCL